MSRGGVEKERKEKSANGFYGNCNPRIHTPHILRSSTHDLYCLCSEVSLSLEFLSASFTAKLVFTFPVLCTTYSVDLRAAGEVRVEGMHVSMEIIRRCGPLLQGK